MTTKHRRYDAECKRRRICPRSHALSNAGRDTYLSVETRYRYHQAGQPEAHSIKHNGQSYSALIKMPKNPPHPVPAFPRSRTSRRDTHGPLPLAIPERRALQRQQQKQFEQQRRQHASKDFTLFAGKKFVRQTRPITFYRQERSLNL